MLKFIFGTAAGAISATTITLGARYGYGENGFITALIGGLVGFATGGITNAILLKTISNISDSAYEIMNEEGNSIKIFRLGGITGAAGYLYMTFGAAGAQETGTLHNLSNNYPERNGAIINSYKAPMNRKGPKYII